MSAQEPFWADLPELDEPDSGYMAKLTAMTDALLAQIRDDRGPLIEIDNAAGDAWIASARAEHDVTEEVGA